MQLWDAAFVFISTILDAILNFDFFFFKQFMMPDDVFELAWSDEPKEDLLSKDNKRSELFASHTCIMLIFSIFSTICRPF